jgi:hypothetical protein
MVNLHVALLVALALSAFYVFLLILKRMLPEKKHKSVTRITHRMIVDLRTA